MASIIPGYTTCMPRAIWSGSISFGLVNVPVKLYSAVHKEDLAFHQLEEGTGARIKYKRVSEKSGREVPWEKIVKGYELGKGRYVMLAQEELEKYQPKVTKTIEIEDFVELEDIDPIYYDATYYVAPAGEGEGVKKAYKLLLDAMEKEHKVGIARFVMRTKQYLAAVRPYDGVLALSTMLFEDEIVPKSEVSELKSIRATVNERELKMAKQIIESLTTDWKPARYADTYREQVLSLIKKKAKGEEIVVDKDEAEPQKVVDLMAALEASLQAAKKPTKETAAKRTSARKKATKATAAKKKSAALAARREAERGCPNRGRRCRGRPGVVARPPARCGRWAARAPPGRSRGPDRRWPDRGRRRWHRRVAVASANAASASLPR